MEFELHQRLNQNIQFNWTRKENAMMKHEHSVKATFGEKAKVGMYMLCSITTVALYHTAVSTFFS